MMTDKEQIIIDGVDITGCTWCDFEPNVEPYCRINDGEDLGCEDNPNCYFKQLARKTQECEEYLKQRNNILEESKRYLEEIRKLQKSQFCVAYEKDCYKVCKQQNCAIKNSYRYRKALEEIEKVCIEYTREFADGATVHYYSLDEILDIINKVKGK